MQLKRAVTGFRGIPRHLHTRVSAFIERYAPTAYTRSQPSSTRSCLDPHLSRARLLRRSPWIRDNLEKSRPANTASAEIWRTTTRARTNRVARGERRSPAARTRRHRKRKPCARAPPRVRATYVPSGRPRYYARRRTTSSPRITPRRRCSSRPTKSIRSR